MAGFGCPPREDNDAALLRAIGGECAGALSVVEPGTPPPDPSRYRYEELDKKRLQDLASTREVAPLLAGGAETRLSLAGAQDKLPVVWRDDRIYLPLGNAPSTHILKLPNPRFPHLTANEAFVTGLAVQIGFDAVESQLLTTTTPPLLLTTRYDRRVTGSDGDAARPAALRLHQEDFCQALGISQRRKYEKEGGPSFVSAIRLVQEMSTNPLADVRRLIEWQAFNVIAGNSDGHGKNLSFLYAAPGRVELAPFYDLMSTRQYDRIARTLAMTVGGRDNPDEIHRAQWTALAETVGIGARVLLGIVEDVVERCIRFVPEWTKEYRARYADDPILQTLPKAITRRARRLSNKVF